MPDKKNKDGHVDLLFKLNGREPNEDIPKMALHAVARDGKVIETAEVADGKRIKLSKRALSADRVVLLAAEVKPDAAALSEGYRLSTAQLTRAAELSGELSISPARWRPLLPFGICVDGSVRKCWWWQIYAQTLNAQIAMAREPATSPALQALSPATTAALAPQPQLTLPVLHRCRPVCEGVVEVYERICCCWPILIPPVIVDIRARLKEIIQRLPEIKLPPRLPVPPDPGPGPDPLPFESAGIFVGGALDEQSVNARADFAFLEGADFDAAKAYVEARPYLIRMICSCGQAHYRGAALIGPDGEFSHCYPGSPWLLNNCHREYAFRVRQLINGVDTVIYDGLAANIWFDAGDDITLTSYNPKAIECPNPDIPVPTDTPFAMLERIGATEAWNLQTPTPTGWDRAAVTAYNDGLCFPAASVGAALGTYLNRNWGGTLGLRFIFTEPLKATGAKYYRVRVTAANALGNPTGASVYLDDPISWKYYENLGGFPPQINIGAQSLNNPADPSFYEIPYPQDRNWLTNYYHATLNTTQFGNGRHLVTLELYDDALNRLVPNNAGDAAGTDTAKAFTYEWWHDPMQASNPTTTTNVPWAGLTHMFWWDNRDCVASIDRLLHSGVPSDGECQFMSGGSNSTFAAEVTAYHPHNPSDGSQVSFMHSWTVRWWRGLGGTPTWLDNGFVPANPTGTANESFLAMLGSGNTKCTFALELDVQTKTFNGSGTLNHLDERDIAAFALEISGP